VSEVMEPTTDTTSTALAVIKTALPTILAADTNDILGKLAAELKNFARDGSTEKGRAEIGSKKRKAGSARQDMIRLADALKEDAQKTIKGVNAEVKVINERFDTLIAWIEAPRVAYEEQEKNRVADHEQAIQRLAVDPAMEHATSEEISAAISWRLEPEARNWQEFHQRAIDAHTASIATLRRWRDAAERREEEAAELARLRAEQAERARLAEIEARRRREEQIAREAAEAARVAAETKAAREAEEARQAAQRLQAEVERKAQAERDAAAQRERDAALAIERTEAARVAAEERAAREKKVATEAAERRQAEAVQAERLRIATEKAAEEAATARRAANRAHQARINGEVLTDILKAIEASKVSTGTLAPSEDLPETVLAKAIIKALAKNEIRHCVISY
jgi:hypothetical protein